MRTVPPSSATPKVPTRTGTAWFMTRGRSKLTRRPRTLPNSSGLFPVASTHDPRWAFIARSLRRRRTSSTGSGEWNVSLSGTSTDCSIPSAPGGLPLLARNADSALSASLASPSSGHQVGHQGQKDQPFDAPGIFAPPPLSSARPSGGRATLLSQWFIDLTLQVASRTPTSRQSPVPRAVGLRLL